MIASWMIAVCVREPRCLADHRSLLGLGLQSLIARPGFLCSAIGRRYACRIYGMFYFVCISRSCRKHSITITLTSNPSGRPFHPTLSVKTSDTLAGLSLPTYFNAYAWNPRPLCRHILACIPGQRHSQLFVCVIQQPCGVCQLRRGYLRKPMVIKYVMYLVQGSRQACRRCPRTV